MLLESGPKMSNRFDAKTAVRSPASVRILLSVVTAVLALFAGKCKAEPADEFRQFYEKHPQYQDFFPFGVYRPPNGQRSRRRRAPQAHWF